jgi:DNA-binding transcriptional MocR family regulator
LHFLLEFHTSKRDAELRQIFENNGIRVAFLEDYRIEKSKELADTHTVVLNYSGVDPTRLSEAIRRLCGDKVD